MKPDLQELVRYWQARLRLQDWQLEVVYKTDLKAPGGNPVYGLCYPFLDDKRARIFIRDPETSAPLASDPPSVEKIVVHELTHLHFAPLSGSSKAEVAAEEQAVWALSGAMVAARGTPDEPLVVRAMLARFPAPVRQTGARHMLIGAKKKAALEAIKKGDGKAALVLLEEDLLGDVGGEPDGDEGTPGETPPPGEAAPPPPPAEGKDGSAPPPPPDGEKKPEGDGEKKPAEAKSAAAPRAAAVPPPAPRAMGAASSDPVVRTLAAEVQRLTAKDAAREADAETAERKQLVAARPGLNDKLRTMIVDPKVPITIARQMAESVAPTARLAQLGTEVLGGAMTVGAGMADAVPELPPAQAAELHRAMGIVPDSAREARVDAGGQWVRPIETPTQARARMAAAQKGQA